MRKLDCQFIKECHCSCHNCIQYKSTTPQNRDEFVMWYVSQYMNDENNLEEKEVIKDTAKMFFTSKEYEVFLFEIQNKGI